MSLRPPSGGAVQNAIILGTLALTALPSVLLAASETRPSALRQLEADIRDCLDPLASADPEAIRSVCRRALLDPDLAGAASELVAASHQ